MKRILTDNGYYENGNYYFYIKNHLGRNVMTVRQDENIMQNNHYYPFGLTMSISDNQGIQPYKYTGKELDMEHGLMLFDYDARQYDPAVGRFTTIDPLAEKYYSISPYAYCNNNPVVQDFLISYNYNIGNGGGESMYKLANSRDLTGNLRDGMDNAHKVGWVFWNPQWASKSEFPKGYARTDHANH